MEGSIKLLYFLGYNSDFKIPVYRDAQFVYDMSEVQNPIIQKKGGFCKSLPSL
ncbi:hypothetical protein OBV_03830 [Oscillibacter valericigenes Sjm18-20]|nr:hypothetical protein OBV_03830 [Oscillibacter valericigenes Sjm18-20]